MPADPHVSVAKHASWGLTKALAKEFSPMGITTNIISPGPIRVDDEDPDMAAHIAGQLSKIPLGRLGKPEEIAGMVSYLCSEPGTFRQRPAHSGKRWRPDLRRYPLSQPTTKKGLFDDIKIIKQALIFCILFAGYGG